MTYPKSKPKINLTLKMNVQNFPFIVLVRHEVGNSDFEMTSSSDDDAPEVVFLPRDIPELSDKTIRLLSPPSPTFI